MRGDLVWSAVADVAHKGDLMHSSGQLYRPRSLRAHVAPFGPELVRHMLQRRVVRFIPSTKRRAQESFGYGCPSPGEGINGGSVQGLHSHGVPVSAFYAPSPVL